MRNLLRLATGGVLATTLLFAGCSDDGPTEPTTGVLEVLLLMDGTDIDPNGGDVFIDGVEVAAIAEDIQISIEDLEIGVYVLEVRGIDANCAIVGSNPRNVRVRGGTTVSEEFSFLCEATGGGGGGKGDED